MQHFDIFQGNLGHPQICLFAVKRQTNEQTWVRRKRADKMQLVAKRDQNIFDLVDKSRACIAAVMARTTLALAAPAI